MGNKVMNIYKEELISHYRYPRNCQIIENPNFETESLNPSCGDEISFQAIIKNNIIQHIGFQGTGCIISQATASMLSEYCLNQNLDNIKKLSKTDILNIINMDLGPIRLKCALLSLEALHRGIDLYKSKS